MSIEMRPPPKMPQPEQWMSEHPGFMFLAWLCLVVGVLLIGFLG